MEAGRMGGEGMAGKICPDKRAFFVEKFIITPGIAKTILL